MSETNAELAALAQDERVTLSRDVLRFNDCDSLGHVNNVVYATLCESGRVRFLEERLRPVLGPSRLFVIVKLAIDFEAELFYPGDVVTATWASRLGTTSFTMDQAIFGAGKRAARAQGVCVTLDPATRRPAPVEGEARAALEGLLRV